MAGSWRKCPLCKGEIDERSGRKLRRASRITLVAIIAVVASISLYSYLDSLRVDNSNDVMFFLPNTLTYSVHQDEPGAAGGIVAIYGNMTNSFSEREVTSYVAIDINDGYNTTHFFIQTGLIESGESQDFSWAYHFDRLNVSACEVEIRASCS